MQAEEITIRVDPEAAGLTGPPRSKSGASSTCCWPSASTRPCAPAGR
jgi:hypothetical protein